MKPSVTKICLRSAQCMGRIRIRRGAYGLALASYAVLVRADVLSGAWPRTVINLNMRRGQAGKLAWKEKSISKIRVLHHVSLEQMLVLAVASARNHRIRHLRRGVGDPHIRELAQSSISDGAVCEGRTGLKTGGLAHLRVRTEMEAPVQERADARTFIRYHVHPRVLRCGSWFAIVQATR